MDALARPPFGGALTGVSSQDVLDESIVRGECNQGPEETDDTQQSEQPLFMTA